jgi:hypothetical protein
MLIIKKQSSRKNLWHFFRKFEIYQIIKYNSMMLTIDLLVDISFNIKT